MGAITDSTYSLITDPVDGDVLLVVRGAAVKRMLRSAFFNGQHVFKNTAPNREVLSLRHTVDGNTFPGLTCQRYDGLEVGAISYGNPGGQAPFADTLFIESSRFWNYETNQAGSGAPPDIAVIQSEYDNGGGGQSLRRRMLFSGSDYSIKVYRKGAASGAGIPTGNVQMFEFGPSGDLKLERTIAAAADTGDKIINKMAGRVRIAAAGTSVTVTNDQCTASSIVLATLGTNDETAYVKNVVPGSGSFVVNLGAAATGEVAVNWWLLN